MVELSDSGVLTVASEWIVGPSCYYPKHIKGQNPKRVVLNLVKQQFKILHGTVLKVLKSFILVIIFGSFLQAANFFLKKNSLLNLFHIFLSDKFMVA